VRGLEFLERTKQAVVFTIRYFWLVEHIVAVVVMLDLLAQTTGLRTQPVGLAQ
jgi:hypothetical protein